jgi:hypothetical protein
MPSRPRRRPMTRHPFMAISDPSPISTQPDVSRLGRHADDFLAWRRRCDHDNTARIMSLIGNDDAASEYGARKQAENPTRCVQTHVDNQLFLRV